MFGTNAFHRNELVMQMQPNEVIYMKAMMKTPGLQATPFEGELDLTYRNRFQGAYLPDAYTRLILQALKGNPADFVRGDEIIASWNRFDPLIRDLESGPNAKKPVPYKY